MCAGKWERIKFEDPGLSYRPGTCLEREDRRGQSPTDLLRGAEASGGLYEHFSHMTAFSTGQEEV